MLLGLRKGAHQARRRVSRAAPHLGIASGHEKSGTPLLVVAKNLGHVDTRMVERHYGHLAQTYVSETIRKHAPQFDSGDDVQVVPFPARAEAMT